MTEPTPTAAGQPADRTCPVCGETVAAEARFCEACGADLKGADPAGTDPTGTDPTGTDPTGTDQAGTDPAGGAGAGAVNGGGPAGAPSAGESSLIADADGEGYPAACPSCGGTIAPDGYCERCGERAPLWRDHFEEHPAPGLAMVCDRGIRHRRNEDAGLVAVHPHGGSVLVVCDGVSSSADSDIASLAAARTAAKVLLEQLPAATPSQPLVPAAEETGGLPTEPLPVASTPTLPDGSSGDGAPATSGDPAGATGETDPTGSTGGVTRAGTVGSVLVQAVAAANEAVVDSVRPDSAGNPPSCTFVAGVVEPTPQGTLLVVGWIGDSRAYWVPDADTGQKPERLSTDDSWAAEEIALGVPREEAEAGPHAHAITRWLGPDAPELVPRRVARLLQAPGWVVLCSDGLWNYCSEPAALADTLRSVAGSGEDGDGRATDGHASPLALARGLVAWANAQGGQDNITVALARVETIRVES